LRTAQVTVYPPYVYFPTMLDTHARTVSESITTTIAAATMRSARSMALTAPRADPLGTTPLPASTGDRPPFRQSLEVQRSARLTTLGPAPTVPRDKAQMRTANGAARWPSAAISGLRQLIGRMPMELWRVGEPPKAAELSAALAGMARVSSVRIRTTTCMPERTATSTKKIPAVIGRNIRTAVGIMYRVQLFHTARRKAPETGQPLSHAQRHNLQHLKENNSAYKVARQSERRKHALRKRRRNIHQLRLVRHRKHVLRRERRNIRRPRRALRPLPSSLQIQFSNSTAKPQHVSVARSKRRSIRTTAARAEQAPLNWEAVQALEQAPLGAGMQEGGRGAAAGEIGGQQFFESPLVSFDNCRNWPRGQFLRSVEAGLQPFARRRREIWFVH
jgi:hypothetical protein